MELAPEDVLRLNVLLASAPQAIRIHESSMTVYGLCARGEARIPLNPSGRHEQYLRGVREMLSGHVLGSPGGYPIYLRRWIRMGQMRSESLEQLLLLGEPEAVTAVVHAPALTEELARRAWWAEPSAENARQMLRHQQIVAGDMGGVLARYLVEHLAFEEDPHTVIETVRLLLNGSLIGDEDKCRIWQEGDRRNAYLVGFLLATPDTFPQQRPAREDFPRRAALLASLAEGGANPMARLLLRALDEAGQTFLATAEEVLERPFNQDVVNALLDAVASYFCSVRLPGEPNTTMDAIVRDAEHLCWSKAPSAAGADAVLRVAPDLEREVLAALVLARLDRALVRPIFSRTTAIGTLMRKKLQPVTGPIFQQLRALQGRARRDPQAGRRRRRLGRA